ncbi:MAG: CIA30 family protein [Spirochaetales bacterium]|nr:CIA30 family protein [Spirochaetales bacterium]
MTVNYSRFCILTAFLTVFAFQSLFGQGQPSAYISLYDFNSREDDNKYQWEDFTDQVMGGESKGSSSLMQEDGELFLRLSGDVSLKNNGGFIQTRMQLASGFNVYDAADYDGVRLVVRGKGDGYYLFYRTAGTFFPWLYYSASVRLSDQWQIIDIPWYAVQNGDFGSLGKFTPSKLKSIALVAYGKEFNAEVDLKQIGLYRN